MRWFLKHSPTRHGVSAHRSPSMGVLLSMGLLAGLTVGTGGDESVRADDLQSVTATSFRSSEASMRDTRSTGRSSRSLRETPTVTAIRRASPSVVNLHGQKTIRTTAASMAGGAPDSFRQVNGMGTGVVIDPRGYVITNYHVVEDVNELNVTLHNGEATRADLIASDPQSDLALVKLRGQGPFPTIPRGHSDDLMIGETVIAIGNAFGYVHTSTEGIISALHRDVPVNETQQYRDLIQTSAGINPGNSGGPLLNIDGEMIGVNVAVRVGAQQIAFAIPIDQVLDTVTEMINRHNNRRMVIGMDGAAVSRGGVQVTRLSEGGSAHQAGLQAGDRLVRINQQNIADPLNYELSVLELGPGDPMQVEFERDGEFFQTQLATAVSSQEFGDPAAALAWQVVGVSVRPAGESFVRRMNSRLRTNYRGGLIVTDVRAGSAASEQGITAGDVLLGIHVWQTAGLEDLAEILDQPNIRRGSKAKFYLVRKDQTLYGHLQLASQGNQLTRR